MSRRLAIAIVALVLTSCAHHAPFVPQDATRATCNTASAGAQCRVSIVEDANGPHACALGRFRVEPDLLELSGGRTAHIRWTMPDRFEFCASDGDGIRLKPESADARPQVFESFADTEDGARSVPGLAEACKPRFNWTWANRPPGPTHAYLIRFRDRKSGEQCTIDPWIKNG